jgi:hypothetical protein
LQSSILLLYFCILLVVMKQGAFYPDIVRGLRQQFDGKALVAP